MATSSDYEPVHATVEVLALDMYGTLVDPIRITTALDQVAPGDSDRLAALWRSTQLEYTFRLAAMAPTRTSSLSPARRSTMPLANRSGGPFDTLRPPPHGAVGSLVELGLAPTERLRMSHTAIRARPQEHLNGTQRSLIMWPAARRRGQRPIPTT